MKHLLLFIICSCPVFGQTGHIIYLPKHYGEEPYKKDIIFLKSFCYDTAKTLRENECITSLLRINKIDSHIFKINKDGSRYSCSIDSSSRIDTFKEDSHFWSIYFKNIKFEKVKFNKNIEFTYSVFVDQTIFEKCSIRENISFIGSYFSGSLHLKENSFNQISDFSNCIFEYDLSIKNTTFLEQVNFDYCKWEDEVIFDHVTFHKLPTFDFVQLPYKLTFRNINFDFVEDFNEDDKIDFSTVSTSNIKRKIGKEAKCYIDLKGTDISRIALPYDRFAISFDGTYTYEQVISTYEAIISSCREAGMAESVKGWDIEYRKIQNRHISRIAGYFINLFHKLWWNFGYSKWKILMIWLPFFFICFFNL